METNVDRLVKPDRSWEKVIMKYNHPAAGKSVWQLLNSFLPYALLWVLMYESLQVSYWITLVLSTLASGFLIRLFIIFHDCGHHSFFRSKKANDIVGIFIGILAFTPYYSWHHSHMVHHATAGNLDKRGVGDVWTLTVEEYREASKWKRSLYRLYRNPVTMFSFGSVYLVLFQNRFSKKNMGRKEKWNVYFTNAGILFMAILVSSLIGLKAYILIQLPVLVISHGVGLWLFYIQHQFDDVSWERNEQWDYKTAALEGSAFLKLPVVLQWFTGNIGFHHIHHLSPRIPNYNLSRCHYENELFTEVKKITLGTSIPALKLRLWDEAKRQMISFREFGRQKKSLT